MKKQLYYDFKKGKVDHEFLIDEKYTSGLLEAENVNISLTGTIEDRGGLEVIGVIPEQLGLEFDIHEWNDDFIFVNNHKLYHFTGRNITTSIPYGGRNHGVPCHRILSSINLNSLDFVISSTVRESSNTTKSSKIIRHQAETIITQAEIGTPTGSTPTFNPYYNDPLSSDDCFAGLSQIDGKTHFAIYYTAIRPFDTEVSFVGILLGGNRQSASTPIQLISTIDDDIEDFSTDRPYIKIFKILTPGNRFRTVYHSYALTNTKLRIYRAYAYNTDSLGVDNIMDKDNIICFCESIPFNEGTSQIGTLETTDTANTYVFKRHNITFNETTNNGDDILRLDSTTTEDVTFNVVSSLSSQGVEIEPQDIGVVDNVLFVLYKDNKIIAYSLDDGAVLEELSVTTEQIEESFASREYFCFRASKGRFRASFRLSEKSTFSDNFSSTRDGSNVNIYPYAYDYLLIEPQVEVMETTDTITSSSNEIGQRFYNPVLEVTNNIEGVTSTGIQSFFNTYKNINIENKDAVSYLELPDSSTNSIGNSRLVGSLVVIPKEDSIPAFYNCETNLLYPYLYHSSLSNKIKPLLQLVDSIPYGGFNTLEDRYTFIFEQVNHKLPEEVKLFLGAINSTETANTTKTGLELTCNLFFNIPEGAAIDISALTNLQGLPIYIQYYNNDGIHQAICIPIRIKKEALTIDNPSGALTLPSMFIKDSDDNNVREIVSNTGKAVLECIYIPYSFIKNNAGETDTLGANDFFSRTGVAAFDPLYKQVDFRLPKWSEQTGFPTKVREFGQRLIFYTDKEVFVSGLNEFGKYTNGDSFYLSSGITINEPFANKYSPQILDTDPFNFTLGSVESPLTIRDIILTNNRMLLSTDNGVYRSEGNTISPTNVGFDRLLPNKDLDFVGFYDNNIITHSADASPTVTEYLRDYNSFTLRTLTKESSTLFDSTIEEIFDLTADFNKLLFKLKSGKLIFATIFDSKNIGGFTEFKPTIPEQYRLLKITKTGDNLLFIYDYIDITTQTNQTVLCKYTEGNIAGDFIHCPNNPPIELKDTKVNYYSPLYDWLGTDTHTNRGNYPQAAYASIPVERSIKFMPFLELEKGNIGIGDFTALGTARINVRNTSRYKYRIADKEYDGFPNVPKKLEDRYSGYDEINLYGSSIGDSLEIIKTDPFRGSILGFEVEVK